LSTLLISDPLFLGHSVPAGHPERPDRLRAVEAALSAPQFASLLREKASPGTASLAELVHPRDYVAGLCGITPEEAFHFHDEDTPHSPGTLPAALAALGSICRAVDGVMTRDVKNAFVAARPPGHHAERQTAMGFCFFNTIAIAARHAQKAYGAERIAIIDWDVHHGNGTQDIFWADRDVLFCSTHEMPLYPGSGALNETGLHDTIINAPLRAGDDGTVFQEAFNAAILPRIRAHRPDLILISAGFDAHRRDPLANLRFEAKDFAWATEKLMGLAGQLCGGRIVSLLEGGYDLEGLSVSVAAHVETLMGA
jgi:acetoin utilization deacetylase AcuC-like enzyme